MQPVPVQTRWWALRIRDVTAQRGLSFPKELIVPALNAGGLEIQPGEFRIHSTNVEVMFQTNTRRRTAVEALKNWAPMGSDGPHRQIWLERDPVWPNPPPFRAIDESHYAINRIRRELERLIREDETAGQSDEEVFEGVANEDTFCKEEVGANDGTIAVKDEDDDDKDDPTEGSENVHACGPECGANRSEQGRL